MLRESNGSEEERMTRKDIGGGGVRATLALAFVALMSAACADLPGSEAPAAEGPWFGVMLPPGLTPHALEVISDRPAAPAVVPPGEARYTELSGEALREHMEAIVGFAVESRTSREVGEGMLWGRITGLPSGNRTVEWAAEQLRAAGIADVELQELAQTEGSSVWLPLAWEARLLGDEAFGVGSRDVVLESAMPLSAGEIGPDGLTAPLVYVGTASPAELARVDVRGRVAVQKVTPQGHTVFVRDPVGPRAQELLERGALAVLTIVDLPGNLRVRDMGCGGGLCFNLGGRDGRFLESVLGEAASAGLPDAVRVRLAVTSERRGGLTSANAVAVLPGSTRPDEYVVVNAHADAWFDGAGDNADGLAVMVGLARHFARPEIRQERSLVFVASAGHHTPGLSGPGNFVSMNRDIVEGTVLVINLEHTAQRHITPARSEHPDGHREWTMDAHEAPIVAGISNSAPFLESLVRRGIERYGTNFVAGPNTMASGEGGSYTRAGLPVLTTMQGPPMYHTTGEVLDMVSTPGLERMARFMAFFLGEVSRAPAAEITPAR
jgi:hypothetical protein